MKSFATRKRAGFLAILLAFVFAFTGIMPVVSNAEEAGNYDIDKPVIGELTMTHNRETVSSDTSLDITLKAEDLGVGIQSVYINFDFVPDGDGPYVSAPTLRYDADGNNNNLTYDEKASLFKGTVSLKEVLNSGRLYISSISVADKNNNKETKSLIYENYSVNVKLENVTDANAVTKITPVYKNDNSQYEDSKDRTYVEGKSNYFKIEFAQKISADLKSLEIEQSEGHSLYTYSNKIDPVDENIVYFPYNPSKNYTGKILSGKVKTIIAIFADGTKKLVNLGNTDTSYNYYDGDYVEKTDSNQENEGVKYSIKEVTVTNKEGNEITQENILTDGRVGDEDTLYFRIKLDKDIKADDISSPSLFLDCEIEDEAGDTFQRDTREVKLIFDQSTQTFTGSLTIDSKMYPSIWGIVLLSYYDMKDSRLYKEVYLDNRSDCFIVKHGSTSIIPNNPSENSDDDTSTDNTGKTPSNNIGKQEVTVPTTDTSVNTATNASDAELAAVNANPDKLIVVEATKDHDGGVKAAPSVVEQEVKAVADAVSKAKSKKAIVKIDMNGANIIPVEVLKEAKGKNVDVIFNMGDYSWTVNGMNIGNIDLKDINLAVDMNTNAIPSDVVKALSGSKPTQQISLRHNGNFGFKATLEMKAPKGEAGKYGNLYWYDSDKKLVFQDSALVKADGTIRLNFSHASDYVIVFGDNMATKSPKTGANVNKNALLMMALMLTLAAASGIFGMMELREANRKRV